MTLLVAAAICVSFTSYRYFHQKNRHERLTVSGLRAKVIPHPYTAGGMNYVSYSFLTSAGEKIKGFVKCGNDCEKYLNASVIYTPGNPLEYEFLQDYNRYSPAGNFAFLFLVCFPAGTWVVYRLLLFLVGMGYAFTR